MKINPTSYNRLIWQNYSSMANITRKLVSCGILVFRVPPLGNSTAPEFLLLRHHNRYDLPKGCKEFGETDLKTACREFNEETGLDEKNIELDNKFLFTHEYTYLKGSETHGKTLYVYLAKLLNSNVTVSVSEEHVSYQWITWNPPHKIQMHTIDPLLEFLEQHWKQHPPTNWFNLKS